MFEFEEVSGRARRGCGILAEARRPIGLALVAMGLSACAGGGSGRASLPAAVAPAADTNLAHASLTLFVPNAATQPAMARRSPAYISSASASVSVTVGQAPAGYAQPAAFVIATSPASQGTCAPAPSGKTCTLYLGLPPGAHDLTVTVDDANNNVLSSTTTTATILAGQDNAIPIVLDARLATRSCPTPTLELMQTTPASGAAGTVCGTIDLLTTAAAKYTIDFVDPAGITFPETVPGAPGLTVSSTGGIITPSIASGVLTLTPANIAGKGTVTIAATGATAGDGFVPQSFTIDTIFGVNTGVVTTYAGDYPAQGVANGPLLTATFTNPISLAFDGRGTGVLYVSENSDDIRAIDTTTGMVTTFATGSSFDGLVSDPQGNVYVACNLENVIRKITPSGAVSIFAGTANTSGTHDSPVGTSATFDNPTGLARDTAGNLYVTDADSDLIREISPQGAVTTLAGNGKAAEVNGQALAASFDTPVRVVVDPSGVVYVTDLDGKSVRRIAAGVVTTVYVGAVLPQPHGLALDAFGDLFVTDTSKDQIFKIAPGGTPVLFAGSATGYKDGTTTAAEFDTPYDFAVAPDGDFYLADYGNNLVRLIH